MQRRQSSSDSASSGSRKSGKSSSRVMPTTTPHFRGFADPNKNQTGSSQAVPKSTASPNLNVKAEGASPAKKLTKIPSKRTSTGALQEPKTTKATSVEVSTAKVRNSLPVSKTTPNSKTSTGTQKETPKSASKIPCKTTPKTRTPISFRIKSPRANLENPTTTNGSDKSATRKESNLDKSKETAFPKTSIPSKDIKSVKTSTKTESSLGATGKSLPAKVHYVSKESTSPAKRLTSGQRLEAFRKSLKTSPTVPKKSKFSEKPPITKQMTAAKKSFPLKPPYVPKKPTSSEKPPTTTRSLGAIPKIFPPKVPSVPKESKSSKELPKPSLVSFKRFTPKRTSPKQTAKTVPNSKSLKDSKSTEQPTQKKCTAAVLKESNRSQILRTAERTIQSHLKKEIVTQKSKAEATTKKPDREEENKAAEQLLKTEDIAENPEDLRIPYLPEDANLLENLKRSEEITTDRDPERVHVSKDSDTSEKLDHSKAKGSRVAKLISFSSSTSSGTFEESSTVDTNKSTGGSFDMPSDLVAEESFSSESIKKSLSGSLGPVTSIDISSLESKTEDDTKPSTTFEESFTVDTNKSTGGSFDISSESGAEELLNPEDTILSPNSDSLGSTITEISFSKSEFEDDTNPADDNVVSPEEAAKLEDQAAYFKTPHESDSSSQNINLPDDKIVSPEESNLSKDLLGSVTPADFTFSEYEKISEESLIIEENAENLASPEVREEGCGESDELKKRPEDTKPSNEEMPIQDIELLTVLSMEHVDDFLKESNKSEHPVENSSNVEKNLVLPEESAPLEMQPKSSRKSDELDNQVNDVNSADNNLVSPEELAK